VSGDAEAFPPVNEVECRHMKRRDLPGVFHDMGPGVEVTREAALRGFQFIEFLDLDVRNAVLVVSIVEEGPSFLVSGLVVELSMVISFGF